MPGPIPHHQQSLRRRPSTSSAKTSSARTESDKADDKADSGEDGVADDDAADEDVVERKRNRVRKVPLEKSAKKIAAEDQPDEPEKPEKPVVDVEPVAAVAEPVTEEAPAKVRHQVASTVISNVVSAIFHVDRRDEPADPGQSAVALTLIATARRADEEPIADPAGPQVATSLVAAGAAPYPVPTGVDVIPWTPPLEWLQKVPVLGRFVVTPTVRLLHLIPFVGDFLHPIIGFPIDHDAPPDAPQARSFIVKSFDGTKIFVNFMPAQGLDGDDEAPTILSRSGLGLPGSTTLDLVNDSFLPHDVIGIGALREEGYNVVTWDPRGEWRSGGRMQLQSPDFEGRDISYIISYLATLPGVELDGANDPKLGMVGASYGGGIQLATAAIDHRIDAIVPTIAWNSLTDVLFPRGAVRSGGGDHPERCSGLTLSRPNERDPARGDQRHPLRSGLAGRHRPAERPRLCRPTRRHHHADAAGAGHGGHAVHVGAGRHQRQGADRGRDHDQGVVVLRRSRRLPEQLQQRRRHRRPDAGLAGPLRQG